MYSGHFGQGLPVFTVLRRFSDAAQRTDDTAVSHTWHKYIVAWTSNWWGSKGDSPWSAGRGKYAASYRHAILLLRKTNVTPMPDPLTSTGERPRAIISRNPMTTHTGCCGCVRCYCDSHGAIAPSTLIHFLFSRFCARVAACRPSQLGDHGVGEATRLPQQIEHSDALVIPGLLVCQSGGKS